MGERKSQEERADEKSIRESGLQSRRKIAEDRGWDREYEGQMDFRGKVVRE